MKNELEHYNQLCECLNILEKWARRGGISGQIKEKYDTTRWYPYFGHVTIHSLIYPRYIYNKFKWKWLWKLSVYSNSFFVRTGIEWLVVKWQIFCYKQAYKECFKKYPNFRSHAISHTELLDDISRD